MGRLSFQAHNAQLVALLLLSGWEVHLRKISSLTVIIRGGAFKDFVYNGLASWDHKNSSECTPTCPYPAWPTPPAKENANYTETIQQGCTAPNQFTHTIRRSHAAHGIPSVEAVLTGITLGCGGSFTPYVRHTTSTDDGVALVQTIGSIIQDDGTYNGGINTPAKTSGGGLTDYKRPTTIVIQGANTFSEFKITDIRWWYKTFNVQTIERDRMRYDMKTDQRQWRQGCGGGDCESFRAGIAAYVRQRSTHMQWSEATHQGSTFLGIAN